MSESDSATITDPQHQAALAEAAAKIELLFKFVHGHRIRYDEVDAQGLVGSGRWLDLLHLARVEYLRNLGLFMEGGHSAPVQLVVRRVACDFIAAARFDDPIILRVRCAALGNTSARFEFLVDNGDGLRLLVAETLMVCVDLSAFRAADWPLIFRERVMQWEGEALQIGQLIR